MTQRDDRHIDQQLDVRTPACDRFDELLPDWLEGTLPAAARLEADRHRGACARCHTLAADLQDLAHSAAALPRLRPEHDLWAGIAERIEPAVVPLDARRIAAAEAESARRPTYTFTRRWLGAAAAALVVVTSGVTYLAARPERGASTPDATRVAVAAPAVTPAAPAPAPASPDSVTPPLADTPDEPAARPAPSDARPASATAADAALAAATSTYDREIAALREVVRRQRADLDSGTVAVLERNLRIIDQAIAQSRAALARDPGSQFLGEQLTRALDSKVELLRTAALLPQRGA